MIFIYSLERHEFILLFVILAVITAICYYFSVKSRKTYTCPECGEEVIVEHMETSRCGMCGSQLKLNEKA